MSRKVRHGRKGWERCAQSVFENSVLGSTGHWPLPSGDSPDGTGATVRANGHGVFATMLAEVPVGRSPTGAGESPAPPIFKTGSQKSTHNVGRSANRPSADRGGDFSAVGRQFSIR